MGRQWFLATAGLGLFVLAGCDTVERVEIRADGSATVTVSVVLERDDPFIGVYGGDFEEWADLAQSDPRHFISQVLALENASDPTLDEMTAEVDDDRMVFTWERDAENLETLTEMLENPDDNRALAGARISQSSGEITLHADAVENLSEFWRELFAFAPAVNVFETGVLDDSEEFASTQTVELVLPGEVVSSDAHDRNGNTLRWSWTPGQAAEPGINVTWDPTGDPVPGFDWWGRDQLIVFALIAVFLVVLVIAGSLGFLGFIGKVDREGRRVASGRWPRR